MSNFQDAISSEALAKLAATAKERHEMSSKQAPWKGTEESVGDPSLGIIQQAIDAVDDNCQFAILEFLKGAHYSLWLYIRNIENELAKAVKEDETADIVYLSTRLGQVQAVYNSVSDLIGPMDEEEEENA